MWRGIINVKDKEVKKFRVFFVLALLLFAAGVRAQDADRARYTNLPAIYIETYGNVGVTSKETYVYATMWYVDENDVVTQYDSLQIRGRGNSTWNLRKKPYRLKFHQKEKFLGKGYAKAKSWTLLANAGDKTLIRNAVTSSMADFMGMKFCPAYKFVDLNLNGTYLGNYQISDQVEVRPHRVNIIEQDYPLGDASDITGGYLLEVDGFADGNCFTTSKKQVPIRIHYPDEDEIVARQNTYIRNYMNSFESVLYGSDYMDAEKGYRSWVDSVSLANWFIGTEVSANIDGYYSTYFYKNRQDSLLYWGPMWDYDIAYDNDYRISGNVNKLMTDVGYGKTKEWVNRMWEDPWFGKLVNRRFGELMEAGMTEHMISTIDSLTALLDESQQLNYEKWGISTRMYHEIVLYSSYDQYISDLKNFILDHCEYLQQAFANKKVAEPTPPFEVGNYYYRILNAGSNDALDVEGQSSEPGGKVCTWDNLESRESEEWHIRKIGDYFHLTNKMCDVALTDPTQGEVGPTVNVGTRLGTAEPDTLDERQLWTFVPQGTKGYYNLVNKYTQHTANLNGGGTANGTYVLSYTTNDRNSSSNNRLWYFVPGGELPVPDAIGEVEPDEYALAYNPHIQVLHFGSAVPEELDFTVYVYTSNGQKVKTFRADEQCSVAELPKGVYVVTWTFGQKVRSAKFLKR